MTITGGRFDGAIAGVGTASGTRFVLGAWDSTPFGPMVDVMVEGPDGHRILIAPDAAIGEFISQTYGFDEVRVESIELHRTAQAWRVTTDTLQLEFDVARRTWLGLLLVTVPRSIARSRTWCRVINPFARLLRPGVRTIGTAGNGREERYCALDEHALASARITWDGIDLGPLAPIDPPVRFGFGSTPKRASLVRVTTFVSE